MTYEDTHNTLKYADRAKKIKIKLKKNVVSVDFHIAQVPGPSYLSIIFEKIISLGVYDFFVMIVCEDSRVLEGRNFTTQRKNCCT